MQEIKVDIELENLLPKLDEEKEKLLEEDILKNGCISPIVLWNGYIVDGHHRYKICKRNNVEFKTKEMQFENKQEAMIWAWTTQKARRNIDDGTLFNIAKVFRPYYEKKAKEQQKLSEGRGVKKGFIKCENLNTKNTNAVFHKCEKAEKEEIKPINTTKELAEIAGTSQSTMNKVIQVQKHAPEPIQKAVENNVISINKGYEITKKIKDLPKENKENEADKLLMEQLNKEDKELDKAHRIFCRMTDAIDKPANIEVTEENVRYWIKDMTSEEIIQEENNINEAINNLNEIKRIMRNYKGIRRVQ